MPATICSYLTCLNMFLYDPKVVVLRVVPPFGDIVFRTTIVKFFKVSPNQLVLDDTRTKSKSTGRTLKFQYYEEIFTHN